MRRPEEERRAAVLWVRTQNHHLGQMPRTLCSWVWLMCIDVHSIHTFLYGCSHCDTTNQRLLPLLQSGHTGGKRTQELDQKE